MNKFLGDMFCHRLAAGPLWCDCRERFLMCVAEPVALRSGGAAAIWGCCALVGSAVEELNAFMFRTKSLSKMYKQSYFLVFNPTNTHLWMSSNPHLIGSKWCQSKGLSGSVLKLVSIMINKLFFLIQKMMDFLLNKGKISCRKIRYEF